MNLGFIVVQNILLRKRKLFFGTKHTSKNFPVIFFFKRVTIIKPEKKVNQWRIKEFLPFGMKIEVIVHVFQ